MFGVWRVFGVSDFGCCVLRRVDRCAIAIHRALVFRLTSRFVGTGVVDAGAVRAVGVLACQNSLYKSSARKPG